MTYLCNCRHRDKSNSNRGSNKVVSWTCFRIVYKSNKGLKGNVCHGTYIEVKTVIAVVVCICTCVKSLINNEQLNSLKKITRTAHKHQ